MGLANLNGNSQYTGNPGWSDVRGTSFDAFDRPISKLELAYGTAPVTKNMYDQSGQLDLLSQTKNALGQITTYAYDKINRVEQLSFSGPAPQADGRTYQFDADGRTATIANSLGTLTYTYDFDGNKISVAEPNGNSNYTAASLICYYYYLDGLREYLSVGPISDTNCSSIQQKNNPGNGGISQPQLFSYAYTEDGLLKAQQVSWGSYTGTFAWTYYPSDRENTESDPLTGDQVGQSYPVFGAKSYTYDPYGRVQQLTLPETFEESQLVYDVDDELAGYNAGYNGGSGTARDLALNARGELLQDSLPGTLYFTYAQGATYSANGTAVGNGECQCSPGSIQAPPTTMQFDVRSGMVTVGTNPFWAQYQGIENGAGAYQYAYDAAGRQSSATQYPNWPSSSGETLIYNTSYDTENHVYQTGNVMDMYPSENPATSEGTVNNWGPDGHQDVMTLTYPGTSSESRTAHWDGDSLLFATSTDYGNTPFLYVGKLGTIDSSGHVIVVDRDQTGSQQTTHGNYDAYGNIWFAGWSMGAIRKIYIYVKASGQIQLFSALPGSCNGPNQHKCDSPPVFPMTRSDGYAMVGGYVQGARTYDPTSGQWITPDAYAGDVHDPMSQKPFMWNDNNPVNWTDPTGYCSDPGGAGTRVCVDAFIQQRTVMGVFAGDNRGFEKNSSNDSYRVRVNINFSDHSWAVHPGVSHFSNGSVSGPSIDHGSYVKVNGNTATVHIDVSVGAPGGLGSDAPPVKADFTITEEANGGVSMSGSHTQFPSFEAYSYGQSGQALNLQYTENPENPLGPLFLYKGEDTTVHDTKRE